MHYVYSTLANDNDYHGYVFPANRGKTSIELPTIAKTVRIKGGAGVATRHLFTPLGIVTQVSDEDLEFLKKNEAFQTHVKNGYIKFDKAKVDVEVAVATMESRDNSAPIVPEDYDPEADPEKVALPSDASKRPAKPRNAGLVKNELR